MIAQSWMAAAALATTIVAGAAGFAAGRDSGIKAEQAVRLAELGRALAAKDRAEQRIALAEQQAARRERQRQTEVRYVYRSIPQIVYADPVYRQRCIGADGVRLLDAAAAAANGTSAATAAGSAPAAPSSAADDRPGDGLPNDRR